MKAVFRKEMREMLRDKRITFGAFVMPVLLLVMMMKLIGSIESTISTSIGSKIGVIKGGEDTALGKALSALPGSKLMPISSESDAVKQVQDGILRLALDIKPGAEAGQLSVKAFYDSAEPMSEVAMRAVQRSISELNKKVAEERLQAKNIDPEILASVSFVETDLAKKQARDIGSLASMLPYLIVLWAFYGGFSAVSDLMAGEKERGTLETLLISPQPRSQILLGKYLALSVICLLSASSAVLGVFLSGSQGSAVGSLNLTPVAVIALLCLLVPLVTMFASILMFVSTWAKSMREAQTYLTAVSFVVLLPAIYSNVIGFTDLGKSAVLKFIPVLSTAVGLRGAFSGSTDWVLVVTSGAIALLVAGFLFVATNKLMHSERVLQRT
jgi:sodium transport system permease protein